jgi:hypothetical protein
MDHFNENALKFAELGLPGLEEPRDGMDRSLA